MDMTLLLNSIKHERPGYGTDARFTYEDAKPLIDDLITHEQWLFRLLGSRTLLELFAAPPERRTEAARRILEIYFTHRRPLMLAHRHRFSIDFAIERLHEEGEAISWFEGLLERAQEGEHWPLTRYDDTIYGKLIHTISRPVPRGTNIWDQKAGNYKRIIDALEDASAPDDPVDRDVEQMRRYARAQIEELAKELEQRRAAQDDELRQQVQVTPLGVHGATKELRSPIFCHYDGDEGAARRGGPLIICWYLEKQSINDSPYVWYKTRFTRSSVYGGDLRVIGDAQVLSRGDRDRQISVIDGSLYVPTGAAGLAVVRDRQTRYLGAAEGAPSDHCEAVVKIDDERLLVAFRKSLAWFDTESETFQTIISSRQVGDEDRFVELFGGYDSIDRIFYVPDADKAYLSLTSGDHLVSFELSTQTFARVKAPPRQGGLGDVRWVAGDLVLPGQARDWVLNPESNEFEEYEPEWWSKGNYRGPSGLLSPTFGIPLRNRYVVGGAGIIRLYGPTGSSVSLEIGRMGDFQHRVPEGLIIAPRSRWFTSRTHTPLYLIEVR